LIRSGCFRTGDKTYLPRYKPRQIFMTVSITICQQFEKMEKQKGTVLKAREKQAINCSNEIFWYFYLMFHVFFKFKQPNNSQNKF
jgi:hypothetical protein